MAPERRTRDGAPIRDGPEVRPPTTPCVAVLERDPELGLRVPAADIARARALARQICGTCHVVSDDSRQSIAGRPPTPSFADLVRRPSFSADGIRQFLSSDHRRLGPEQAMPNPRLTEYQNEEIVAYLETLRAKQGR